MEYTEDEEREFDELQQRIDAECAKIGDELRFTPATGMLLGRISRRISAAVGVPVVVLVTKGEGLMGYPLPMEGLNSAPLLPG